MRITNVIGALRGGGAERVCVNLANSWAKRGRQVTILTVAHNSTPPAFAVDGNVELVDIGWPRHATHAELRSASIATILRGLEEASALGLVAEITLIALLRNAILASRPDVVVSHIDMTNVRVLAAAYQTGIPIVVHEHTDTTQVALGHWQSIRQALYRRASAVVGSHFVVADWASRRGATAYAIPNALVGPHVNRSKPKSSRKRVVSIARLAPEKRPALLVRAFAKIATDFPDWDLEIYGDGPLLAPLVDLSEDLAPARIHLCGFVTDVYEVLSRADLFVSSSWVEGFGNSIWEALACGVPVVAMDCGAAVRSLVRDGIDGVIVRGSGITALASAMCELISNDRRRTMCADRAPDVLKRFPIESSLQAWDALFAEVLSPSTNREEKINYERGLELARRCAGRD